MYKGGKKVIDNGIVFEQIVKNIFKYSNYKISDEFSLTYDFIAEIGNTMYRVNTKYSLSNGFYSVLEYADNITKESILSYDFNTKIREVLVIGMVITDEQRRIIKRKYDNLVLIDLANLLYVTSNNDEIRTKLLSILSFTIDEIVPKRPVIKLSCTSKKNEGETLIRELSNIDPGLGSYRSFENLCCKCMKYMFSNTLTLFNEQVNSNNDLYRFDLICRVKNGSRSEFWSIVEDYFKSKYILFEFKNHSKKITQKEVYTTEKYLYKKAFRNVAIVVSFDGNDDNSLWAAKGCLRENGKLIMLIDKSDVIEMIKKKEKNEDPSDYLLDILDDMLIELEK